MQTTVIEPVASPPRVNAAGRKRDRALRGRSAPAAGFDALLHVMQAVGNLSVASGRVAEVPLDATVTPTSPDARANRLSTMKADDRASRVRTGSRIAGSEVSPDALADKPPVAPGVRERALPVGSPLNSNSEGSHDRSRSTGGRAYDGNAPKTPGRSSQPVGGRSSTTEHRSPRPSPASSRGSAEGAPSPDTTGNAGGQSTGAVPVDASVASTSPTGVSGAMPVSAGVQATRPPVSTTPVPRVAGARSAQSADGQLRDGTPGRVQAGRTVRRGRPPAPKSPEQHAAIERIVKTIQAGVRGKETVARIELKPASLGHVRVRMHLRDDVLQVRVAAETDDARRVLSSQVDALRSALEQQGVKVQRLAFHGPADGDSTAGNPPQSPRGLKPAARSALVSMDRHHAGDSGGAAFNGDTGQAFTTRSDGGQRGRDDPSRQARSEPRASARADSASALESRVDGDMTQRGGTLRLDIRI